MKDDANIPDTTEFPSSPLAPSSWPDTGSSRVQVDMACVSDRGLVRAENEDHFLTMRGGRWLETVQTSLPKGDIPDRSDEHFYGMLVADGMGGSVGGELASRTALSVMISLVLHTPDWIFSEAQEDVQRRIERSADRYRKIQEVFRKQALDDPDLSEMGTTLTTAASFGSTCLIGHIGDSRAYLLRDEKLIQLTRDHTYVQVMVDSGLMSPEQAADHPWRHILSRALGGESSGEGDFNHVELADGDQLLLCTDGLTNLVLDGDIAAILVRTPTAADACRDLVQEALKNGGYDNVTVAVARYKFAT